MNAEGREQILKVFERPGDTFCIASAFGTERHIVSAKATTKTRLHLLDLAAVKKLIRQYPEIGLKLVTTAGEHMTHLVALADDLALKTVASRLAKHLDELAAMQAAGNHEGSLLPRARLREEELAALLGTVRVHISRSLRDLARAGAIEVNRRFIKIRDPAVLRQIARGK